MDNQVITMDVDALTPWVIWTSSYMASMQDKLIFVFDGEWF